MMEKINVMMEKVQYWNDKILKNLGFCI